MQGAALCCAPRSASLALPCPAPGRDYLTAGPHLCAPPSPALHCCLFAPVQVPCWDLQSSKGEPCRDCRTMTWLQQPRAQAPSSTCAITPASFIADVPSLYKSTGTISQVELGDRHPQLMQLLHGAAVPPWFLLPPLQVSARHLPRDMGTAGRGRASRRGPAACSLCKEAAAG